MNKKSNKPKPIRAWNLFEVAALYRYVNVMANLKNVTSGCFFFSRGVGGPRLVLPGDVLIFLGYDAKKPIFLHQKTGEVLGCELGQHLFHKLAGANEQE